MQNCLCYTSIYCGVLRVLIDDRSSRFPTFHCDIVSCELARRGVPHGPAEASGIRRVLNVVVVTRSV